MRFGKIPSRIALICAAPRLFKCGWEDIDVSIAEDRNVVPCFAADAESVDATASARTWAKNFNIGQRQPDVAIVEQVEDNSPRKLTLVGLEKRQEGGRSWKVIDHSLRLFDLREDVLLETMLSLGGTKGGALDGEYIFARVGTQMRLIRVGSTLHAEMVKGEQRRTSSNIAEADLEVGGLYANRKGTFIYLGRIDTIEEIFNGFGTHCNPFTAQGNAQKKKLIADAKIDVVQTLDVIGEHMSLQLGKYDQADPERALHNAYLNSANYSTFQFGKSVTAVEFIRKLTVADNLIERLRMRSLETTDNRITGMEHPKYVDGFGDAVTGMKLCAVRNVSAMLNIRVHGQGACPSSEYVEFLKRCNRPI